ncbi:MAG: hypothetical protein WA839_06310 [Flavobacteriaceae bacterium]
MLSFKNKITFLKEILEEKERNYADSFKNDLYFFIGDFIRSNPNLLFLKTIDSRLEIDNWVNKMTSRIVLKFDEEFETINDFIYDYIENG